MKFFALEKVLVTDLVHFGFAHQGVVLYQSAFNEYAVCMINLPNKPTWFQSSGVLRSIDKVEPNDLLKDIL